ncbi:hypothetical protein TNCV_1006621 [Trichonephila clavipes]|nr:hypothetical protein TNCV_1006621 [Trichonephila clavipes]
MVSMLMLGKTRPLPGHEIVGSMKKEIIFILECLHPPRSPTREAVCRSSGKYQARRLLRVHLEYSDTASGTNPTAMSLRGHRREVSPADWQAHSYLPSTAKRRPKIFPGHHFPPYGTPHTANMRVEKPMLLVEKKNQTI